MSNLFERVKNESMGASELQVKNNASKESIEILKKIYPYAKIVKENGEIICEGIEIES